MPIEQITERVLPVYKSRQDKALQLLEYLQGGARTRSDIHFELRMSYAQLEQYEGWMSAYAIVLVKDNTWSITEKGKKYCKALQTADNLLKGACA